MEAEVHKNEALRKMCNKEKYILKRKEKKCASYPRPKLVNYLVDLDQDLEFDSTRGGEDLKTRHTAFLQSNQDVTNTEDQVLIHQEEPIS